MKHKRNWFILTGLIVGCIGLANYQNPPLPTSTHGTVQAATPSIHDLVNQERTRAGLQPLQADPLLDQAAANKCADMVQYSYWAHDNPNGTTPWVFINAAHPDYLAAAENLAKGYANDGQVLTGWMNSPTHKANILTARYDHVGYGRCDNIVVQHFTDQP